MTNLTNQRAIVSGSTRGIGRGIAIELARAGAEVVINYRGDRAGVADEVIAECVAVGGRAHKVAADFSDRAQIERFVDRSCELMGGLDIVVSNAVYSDRRLFVEQDIDEFQQTIQVSMMGAYYLLRASAIKLIAAGQGGSMVVISSLHADKAVPGSMAYNMSKAANDQMAKTAACELARHRIRVNLIHPGWIDTPGERKFFTEETLQAQGSQLPWGRLGTAQDIGRGVVYLCDPQSEYITGSTLTIDGGISLPWKEMYRVDQTKPVSGPSAQ